MWVPMSFGRGASRGPGHEVPLCEGHEACFSLQHLENVQRNDLTQIVVASQNLIFAANIGCSSRPSE